MPTVRIALAVNSRSGDGSAMPARLADLLQRAGAKVELVSLADLERPLPGGTTRVVIAGGDGSIGTAAAAARAAGATLAVLPTGTANDFANALGLPLDLEQGCELVASPSAPTRRVEVATFDGHPFVNAAAAGLTTHASRYARPLKPRLGALAYPVGAVRAAVTEQPLHCEVCCDGTARFDGEVWQVVVAATGVFGGGSAIGGTQPDDGELDVAVVPSGPRVELIRRAWGMRRWQLTEQRGVGHHRGREVEIRTPEGTRFNVDGELRAASGTTLLGLLPGGVEVVTP